MNKFSVYSLLVTALLLSAMTKIAQAADWTMTSEDATVTINYKGAPVVDSNYIFWGQNWKWVSAPFKMLNPNIQGHPFSADIPDLGLKINGAVSEPVTPNALQFSYSLNAEKDMPDVIGGGLEFHLHTDSPAFGGKAPEPVLLENHTGWKWPVGNGDISVTFSEPIADVYFEQGRKNTIRAMFYAKSIAAGRKDFMMRVQLPTGGVVAKSAAERYGQPDTSKWYRDAFAWNTSPVDLSFLNDKPAGKHGFLKAQGDNFVFADGTPAKFWGSVIAAYAVFADKNDIKQQAHRMAQLGYNLMRIHHHDSTAWVSPTVIDKKLNDSQHLDAEGMDKLDWWIKCLQDEGIYVWLDLHVGRQFKAGDNIPQGFDEISKQHGEGKGFNYFNPRVQQLMQDFNTQYLNHVNPYTHLAYKDDPAIMGLLITNENDVTHHFGNMMLGDKGNPVHNAIFNEQVKNFATAKNLSVEQTGHTWEPGPSKLFLNQKEHEFNAAMITHLHQLGVKVPISTTNYWGNDGLYSLPALTDGDMIDVHSYGQAEALSVNPRYSANFIPWIGAAQVYGKPLTITEWNVEYPSVDRFTGPMYLMSIAALQGWDAPMLYNYSQRGFDKPGNADKWSTFYDPGLNALTPAAAIAFRQGHISPARNTYCLQLSRDQLYNSNLDPNRSAAIRTLVEQSRLTVGMPAIKELPWNKVTQPAPGVRIITDPQQDFIPANQSFVQSDTGELRRDWEQGIQTINTPKTQCASGWIGGQAQSLKDVTFNITTPKATVAVTSLDNAPIAQSHRILITAIARVVASPGEKMPYLSEPVNGTITVHARPNLKLIPLAADGTALDSIPLPATNSTYTISLPAVRGTHWFILQ
ncbi:MAG: hypothetical protein JO316_08290 [Abitibacteriaceae bacterium]|nr:hypothetical protein [Abditibacteriaceae bacterium]